MHNSVFTLFHWALYGSLGVSPRYECVRQRKVEGDEVAHASSQRSNSFCKILIRPTFTATSAYAPSYSCIINVLV